MYQKLRWCLLCFSINDGYMLDTIDALVMKYCVAIPNSLSSVSVMMAQDAKHSLLSLKTTEDYFFSVSTYASRQTDRVWIDTLSPVYEHGLRKCEGFLHTRSRGAYPFILCLINLEAYCNMRSPSL